jgi:hypothetical protein
LTQPGPPGAPSFPPKVYLKNIAHRYSANDIKLWVRGKLKDAELGVERIDVPIDKKGYNLGYGYVHLKLGIDPSHIVRMLHQGHFRNRTISARLVNAEDHDGQLKPPREPQAARGKHCQGNNPTTFKTEHHKHRTSDIVVAWGSYQGGSGTAH